MPKLDNARTLRGIYFIDPEDKEFKETIKNARKKLETPVAPAMLRKTSKNSQHVVTSGKSNEIKSKLAYILEASEFTRLRMGEFLPNHHENHFAGKGDNSLQHYNLVHKFIPMLQTMKIPAAKAAVDKESENLGGKKRTNLWREREKSAKFWASHPSGPSLTLRTPTLPAPTSGSHPSGPNPFGPPPFGSPLYLRPWGPHPLHPPTTTQHTKKT